MTHTLTKSSEHTIGGYYTLQHTLWILRVVETCYYFEHVSGDHNYLSGLTYPELCGFMDISYFERVNYIKPHSFI